MSDKICKNCSHFIRSNDSWINAYLQPIGLMVSIDHKCEHHQQISFSDPVNGYIRMSGPITSCYDERAEVSHIENKCGPEGRYFKEKNAN